MANSIDWGTLALGAVIGVGCQKELRSAAKIASATVATLACAAADAAADAANAVAQSTQQAGQDKQG